MPAGATTLAAGVEANIGFMFTLELGGAPVDNVTEISGLAMETTPVERKMANADGKTIQEKAPGKQMQPGTFTAKLYADPGGKIEKTWFDKAKQGMPEVGPAAVIVYDSEAKKVLTFKFTDAFVKDLAWGELSAAEPQPMQLELTIQFNKMSVTP